jgi:hypothetical protein
VKLPGNDTVAERAKGELFATRNLCVGKEAPNTEGEDQDGKRFKAVVEKEQITWRSFVDPGQAGAGPIATRWHLSTTPTFYVIDHRGVIRHKWAALRVRRCWTQRWTN